MKKTTKRGRVLVVLLAVVTVLCLIPFLGDASVEAASCSHTWVTVTTKQPTCGSAGTYVTKCSKCGAGSPNGNGPIPATGKHNWSLTSTTKATCTANGSKNYTCTVCKQTKKETITKLGHSFSQVTTKQPTCGTTGTYETKCSRCGTGSSNGNGTIPATGKHNWSLTSTTNATCTANGSKNYTCTVCKQTKKETINKLGHAYSQVTTKQPTCGAAGTYVTKCSRCGAGSSNGNGSIPATGKHTWDRTAATCTAAKKCTVCGAIGEAAKGHNWDHSAATCTEAKKCKTCGTVGQAAKGHTWNISSATCTTDKKCTVCGTISQKALGHSFAQVTTKQPTCGVAGTYETKCSRCGTGSPNGNGTIAPTGKHNFVYTSTTNATCTADGYKLYTCSVCKQTKKETIAKLGHSFSQVTTKQPTCGTAGTYETKCSRCGTGSPNGNGTIAPTGNHKWEYTSTTNATCTADGYKLYTCSVCKQTKKETINKLGHSFSQVTTKQPTCGTAGTYETKCSRCGTGSSTGNGTIAPTGNHKWEYTSTTNATCTADGYKLYTCSVCKQTKKETITKLGHSFSQVTTKEPTCGAAGTYETKCSRCGTGSPNGNGTIPATGKHKWNVSEATCSTEKKCTVCGKVDKTFLAHTCTWITVPAGSGYGKMEYVCSVCNKTTAELFISGLSTGAKPSAYIKVKADTPAVNKFLLPSFGIPVNYQLLGYSTQANATKKEYTTGTTVSIPADGKLYAVVVPREYTVVYHDIPYSSDGTESEVHTADVDFEIEHKYLDDEPFRWCRGWSKTKNASEPTFVYGKRYDYKLIISAQDLSDSNPNNNTVHLYPVWGDKKFTVRYEWLTGCQDVVHDSVNDYLTKGEVVPPATINNCHFIGWTTDYDSAYVFSNKNTIADVLPMMNYDDSTLYAVYGNQGEAPAYILDSQYVNSVWADGRNVSMFIRRDYVDQLIQEAKNWGGINDTSDSTSTNGYPMLEQVRNALYFGSSGYRLADVCNILNSKIGQINKSGLLYLEIRVLNDFDGVSLSGVYVNYVAPRHKDGKWYDLNSFAATLPNNTVTRLSNFLTVSDGDAGETYGGDQGDYEEDKDFLTQLREIVKDGIITTPKGMTKEQLTDYRMSLFGGGICGPMAAVNVALYFTDSDKTVTKDEVRNELLDYFTMENGAVAWNERQITKNKEGHGGDGWASVTDYLSAKLSRYGKSVSAGFEGIQGSTDEQLRLTKKMISEGTPVIMSFYSVSEDCMMYKLVNNTLQKWNTCGAHYVIVTGVFESASGESVYLKVSSWGEEYYINWNEYVAKANIGIPGDMGCGYAVIK